MQANSDDRAPGALEALQQAQQALRRAATILEVYKFPLESDPPLGLDPQQQLGLLRSLREKAQRQALAALQQAYQAQLAAQALHSITRARSRAEAIDALEQALLRMAGLEAADAVEQGLQAARAAQQVDLQAGPRLVAEARAAGLVVAGPAEKALLLGRNYIQALGMHGRGSAEARRIRAEYKTLTGDDLDPIAGD